MPPASAAPPPQQPPCRLACSCGLAPRIVMSVHDGAPTFAWEVDAATWHEHQQRCRQDRAPAEEGGGGVAAASFCESDAFYGFCMSFGSTALIVFDVFAVFVLCFMHHH